MYHTCGNCTHKHQHENSYIVSLYELKLTISNSTGENQDGRSWWSSISKLNFNTIIGINYRGRYLICLTLYLRLRTISILYFWYGKSRCSSLYNTKNRVQELCVGENMVTLIFAFWPQVVVEEEESRFLIPEAPYNFYNKLQFIILFMFFVL